MSVPVLAGLFLEITSAVILLMIVSLILHQATAMWDVSYASKRRIVSNIEQHVHSVLEMVPFAGFALIVSLHWNSFASLFGRGALDFSLRLKADPLPWLYSIAVLSLTAALELLPYLQELWRGLRARRSTADESCRSHHQRA